MEEDEELLLLRIKALKSSSRVKIQVDIQSDSDGQEKWHTTEFTHNDINFPGGDKNKHVIAKAFSESTNEGNVADETALRQMALNSIPPKKDDLNTTNLLEIPNNDNDTVVQLSMLRAGTEPLKGSSENDDNILHHDDIKNVEELSLREKALKTLLQKRAARTEELIKHAIQHENISSTSTVKVPPAETSTKTRTEDLPDNSLQPVTVRKVKKQTRKSFPTPVLRNFIPDQVLSHDASNHDREESFEQQPPTDDVLGRIDSVQIGSDDELSLCASDREEAAGDDDDGDDTPFEKVETIPSQTKQNSFSDVQCNVISSCFEKEDDTKEAVISGSNVNNKLSNISEGVGNGVDTAQQRMCSTNGAARGSIGDPLTEGAEKTSDVCEEKTSEVSEEQTSEVSEEPHEITCDREKTIYGKSQNVLLSSESEHCEPRHGHSKEETENYQLGSENGQLNPESCQPNSENYQPEFENCDDCKPGPSNYNKPIVKTNVNDDSDSSSVMEVGAPLQLKHRVVSLLSDSSDSDGANPTGTKRKQKKRKKTVKECLMKQEGINDTRDDLKDLSCSICLGPFENRSFLKECFHSFCYVCIIQWSELSRLCPLCKVYYKTLIHEVTKDLDYQQYDFPTEEKAKQTTTSRRSRGEWQFSETMEDGRRFRYQSTLADHETWRVRRAERQRIEQLQAQSLNQRKLNRRLKWSATKDRRKAVYRTNMYVKRVKQRGKAMTRDISPEFFADNPAIKHRLVPWLLRDLNVLLGSNDEHIRFVMSLILNLISKIAMDGEDFKEQLKGFLFEKTAHFVAELISFSRSPYDIRGYDENVVYDVHPTVICLENDQSEKFQDRLLQEVFLGDGEIDVRTVVNNQPDHDSSNASEDQTTENRNLEPMTAQQTETTTSYSNFDESDVDFHKISKAGSTPQVSETAANTTLLQTSTTEPSTMVTTSTTEPSTMVTTSTIEPETETLSTNLFQAAIPTATAEPENQTAVSLETEPGIRTDGKEDCTIIHTTSEEPSPSIVKKKKKKRKHKKDKKKKTRRKRYHSDTEEEEEENIDKQKDQDVDESEVLNEGDGIKAENNAVEEIHEKILVQNKHTDVGEEQTDVRRKRKKKRRHHKHKKRRHGSVDDESSHQYDAHQRRRHDSCSDDEINDVIYVENNEDAENKAFSDKVNSSVTIASKEPLGKQDTTDQLDVEMQGLPSTNNEEVHCESRTLDDRGDNDEPLTSERKNQQKRKLGHKREYEISPRALDDGSFEAVALERKIQSKHKHRKRKHKKSSRTEDKHCTSCALQNEDHESLTLKDDEKTHKRKQSKHKKHKGRKKRRKDNDYVTHRLHMLLGIERRKNEGDNIARLNQNLKNYIEVYGKRTAPNEENKHGAEEAKKTQMDIICDLLLVEKEILRRHRKKELQVLKQKLSEREKMRSERKRCNDENYREFDHELDDLRKKILKSETHLSAKK